MEGRPNDTTAVLVPQIMEAPPNGKPAIRVPRLMEGRPNDTTAIQVPQIMEGRPSDKPAIQVPRNLDGRPNIAYCLDPGLRTRLRLVILLVLRQRLPCEMGWRRRRCHGATQSGRLEPLVLLDGVVVGL